MSTWTILFTILVTISWTLWGWGHRGVADGPLPPVRDVGAIELPLVPSAHGAASMIPPERLRPQPRHAVHRIQVNQGIAESPTALLI